MNYMTSTKFEEIKLYLLDAKNRPRLDILTINETFFTSQTPDHLYSVPGFTIYRRDRKDDKNGGGVMMYVNNELKHSRRTDLEDFGLEII